MAANGQKLRVAVTKTSAQGKSVQSATPNLMSFSTDENSIWFNGNRYGAFHLKRVEMLSASSTSSEIASVIGEATEDNFISIVNFIAKGGLFIVQDKWREYVAISNYNNTGDKRYVQFEYIKLDNNTVYNRIKFDFNGSSWSFNVFRIKTDDIVNNLTSTDTTKPLSAAMGKELNDKISDIKIKIFESLSSKTEGEDVTDIVGKLTDDWNLHPEEYIFYIRDDSELCIAPCTVYYEAEMRYLSYQVNGTIYEYDCEYTNDICNLVGIYTFHATPD
jgi:hypothetical protein